MKIQISPASIHSHQLRDPLVDMIGYKVVWFTAVLRRKYSAIVLTVDFAHGFEFHGVNLHMVCLKVY